MRTAYQTAYDDGKTDERKRARKTRAEMKTKLEEAGAGVILYGFNFCDNGQGLHVSFPG